MILFQRRFIFIGLILIGCLYFIYTTIIPTIINSSCKNQIVYKSFGGGHVVVSDDTIIRQNDDDEEIKSQQHSNNNISQNIFVREKFHIIQLIGNTVTNNNRTTSLSNTIDLLLNTRKLTLFAVHELNQLISMSSVGCGEILKCLKWWANPLNTLSLKTTTYMDYYEHGLTFIANPGNIPYYVQIQQNFIPPIGINWTELKIKGHFIRLDGGESMSPPLAFPLSKDAPRHQNSSLIEDEDKDTEDPELYSWLRNQSFIVGDYVDFNNRSSMYKISPGGNISTAQNLYCGKVLKMLVMVSSAPLHFKHRAVIRETYGSTKYLNPLKVKLVFLFGLVRNSTLQDLLSKEAEQYDDIIQVDFMDSYHNLSLSHLSMYNWIQTTCESVGLPKYVLKADDDFLLNIELALKVAYQNPNYELIGTQFCHTSPIRNTAYMTKYYTPRYMHMPDRYAGYLSGVAYLLRTDIIPRMLHISLTTPMIHMDDAYITGILPRQLKIYPVGSSRFTYTRSKLNPCSIKEMACSYILNTEDMRAQWDKFIKPVPKDCNLTTIVDNFISISPLTKEYMEFCDYT